MLFLFSVCHVIVFLHEGLQFDTQILKKFRVLQAAKRALSPFVRTQIAASTLPKSSASMSQSRASSISPPPGRPPSRHSSSISLMSGSANRPSVSPGYCAPVILFVFVDDISDGPNSSSSLEHLPEVPCSSKAPVDNSGSQKSNPSLKSSGSVIMLARPASKGEGSFKKKLLMSLDTQIRFLIKKCRILAGTETGLRRAGNANALPLFSVDASRIVVLLDGKLCRRGESLAFITGLIGDTSSPNGNSDVFTFGNQSQTLNCEGIQMIKDFIYRQSDILRGKGGLTGNMNSGSVAGVGMVAAAAAAAAASTSAGTLVTASELPSLDNWLSSSVPIISSLLSVGHTVVNETEKIRMLSLQSRETEMHNEHFSRPGSNAAELALSCLESSINLNLKFSVSWCKRALPAAKEVYLKDLPACYPSSVHNAQLEKALTAFRAMVKGPAIHTFIKELEDECTSIWKSGRQLCDAISLTGKPCMHQRHIVNGCDSKNGKNQHSSGYFFLHACACGRSRRLREDPFDFDSANLDFNSANCCEDTLPAVVLPKGSNASLLPPTSWRLLRLGGARYYEPSKGLLQVGFCPKENFLLKCTVSLGKQKGTHAVPAGITMNDTIVSSPADPGALTVVNEEKRKVDISAFPNEVPPGSSVYVGRSTEAVSSNDTNISFGKGFPSFTMKKPFSEVVAGNAPVDSTSSNHKHNKQHKVSKPVSGKLARTVDETDGQVHKVDNHPGSQRTEQVNIQETLERPITNKQNNGNPLLQIGSNLVPVKTSNAGKEQANSYGKPIVISVGFEHECSYGHRFLLTPKHLQVSDSVHSTGSSDANNVDSSSDLPDEVAPFSFGTTTVVNNARSNKSIHVANKCGQQGDKLTSFFKDGTGKCNSVPGFSTSSYTIEGLEGSLSHVKLDDGDCAFSILNRDLPIYMNCPHCKASTVQNYQDIKFASTVSQLQRIFLVTPSLPTVLATSPVVQFKNQSLTLGCQVILPPESFLSLRLPFVYGIGKSDGSLGPLHYLKHQPEFSAWLKKSTAVQVISLGHSINEKFHMH